MQYAVSVGAFGVGMALEKQGYISRSRQDADERSLYVELTEEGKVLKDKAIKVPSEMEGFSQLPKDDIINFKKNFGQSSRSDVAG